MPYFPHFSYRWLQNVKPSILDVLLASDNRMVLRITLRLQLIEVYVAHHLRTALIVFSHVILQTFVKYLVAWTMKSDQWEKKIVINNFILT